jgi:tetratricopeptide (TPR) repeat protein
VRVRRLIAIAALAIVVAAGVSYMQRLGSDRRYRQLLVDGEHALAEGQRYRAIELFSGALVLRPGSMAAYYRRGEAYREERLYDKAIGDLREAARLSPNAPQPLEALGRLHDERNEPAQAAEWYRQAATRLQDDPGLLYSLALALYQSGSPAAAQDPLRRALSVEDSAEGRYLLGLVYRDARKLDEAAAELEYALRLSPALIPAREELADLYREARRGADELRELRALVALDDQIDRHIAVGLAQARSEQYDEALRTLQTAAVTAPSDSRVVLAIGRVLLTQGERTGTRRSVERAIAALERALGGNARRSEGLALYGRALYLSGRLEEAERILQEALATSPIDAEAFGFLADAAERASHPAVARDALMDLDALQGDTISAEQRGLRARRIGALSLQAADPATALRFLGQALDAAPADAGTLGLMARARWQTGDREGAKAALGQALALNATDPALRSLTKTIR